MKKYLISILILAGVVSAPALADVPEFTLAIKDHKFTPDKITIPAETRVKLVVDNQDATAEEFESNDFHREKVIAGNSKATILVGPLKPGKYKFFGEFHMDTAQGVLKVE